MSKNGYNKTRVALIKAVVLLCKPMIRLLIEKGVTFPQFRELIKTLYVEVAKEHFSLDDKIPSDSRIFVLTGVHRKDIKRLRLQAEQVNQKITSSASLSGEIVARWSSMAEYQDETGNPRPLLKSGKSEDEANISLSSNCRPMLFKGSDETCSPTQFEQR